MAKRATAAKQAGPEESATRPRAADRFSIYADRARGERWRRYCLKHGITFTDLAAFAVDYAIDHLEPPKRTSLQLPRGTRLRPLR